MSAEWQKALIFSILFHLILAIGMILLSYPVKPQQPKIVKINLRPTVFKVSKYKATRSIKTIKQRKTSKQRKSTKQAKSSKQKAIYKPKLKSKEKNLQQITKKVSKNKKLIKKRKVSKNSSSHEIITKTEEEFLKKRLALLKAKAILSKHTGGLSLSGKGISKDILTRMAAHLKAFWEVPVILKDRLDLYAEVELEIAPDGKILSWRFLRSSGEPLFDEAVKSTIKKADPLPPPGRHLIIPAIFRIEEE